MARKQAAPPTDETAAEDRAIRAILHGVHTAAPTPTALQAYKTLLKERSDVATWAGDLCIMAERQQEALLYKIGCTTMTVEACRTRKGDIRRALGYPAAPMLEQLLIDQIVVCWFHVYHTETQWTVAQGQNVRIDEADYWQRRLTQAQKRYLRAIETLARVRKLKLPAVQVNIAAPGGQQVNIAGDVTT